MRDVVFPRCVPLFEETLFDADPEQDLHVLLGTPGGDGETALRLIKRMGELKALLGSAKPGLVFVTAFPDRRRFLRYFGDVAWETEVWIAESPGHLVHFDGDRLLGPYGGEAR